MALHGWTMTLKPGCEAEYDRAHREIWPEMLAMLHGSGITQYSIFRAGRTVFGCMDTPDIAATRAHIAASPVNARWQAEMTKLVEPDPRRTGPGVAMPMERAWDMPAPKR